MQKLITRPLSQGNWNKIVNVSSGLKSYLAVAGSTRSPYHSQSRFHTLFFEAANGDDQHSVRGGIRSKARTVILSTRRLRLCLTCNSDQHASCLARTTSRVLDEYFSLPSSTVDCRKSVQQSYSHKSVCTHEGQKSAHVLWRFMQYFLYRLVSEHSFGARAY